MQAHTKKRHTDKLVDVHFRVHPSKVEYVKRYVAEIKPEEPDESRPWREVVAELFPNELIPAGVLRSARDMEGITQRRLAELTGIDQRHISEMERGKRTIGKEIAKKFAMVFRTDYRIFL
jgi:DNA-binding XRE family transcriptional regulator